uniref:Uncharacterized protein n=1 Tax=viral metagenome TaxID=1070528 RepID=A0A6C0I2V7_9ZZZZ
MSKRAQPTTSQNVANNSTILANTSSIVDAVKYKIYMAYQTMTLFFSNKFNILYLFLGIIFVIFGILVLVGKYSDSKVKVFTDYVISFFVDLSHSTGQAIQQLARYFSTFGKGTVEIASGTILSIGSILDEKANLDPLPSTKATAGAPDNATNSIQNPISAAKSSWCLVGQDGSNRGCVEVKDTAKCLSGQIFPTQQLCLNPTPKQG